MRINGVEAKNVTVTLRDGSEVVVRSAEPPPQGTVEQVKVHCVYMKGISGQVFKEADTDGDSLLDGTDTRVVGPFDGDVEVVCHRGVTKADTIRALRKVLDALEKGHCDRAWPDDWAEVCCDDHS